MADAGRFKEVAAEAAAVVVVFVVVVDEGVARGGVTPLEFKGPWETEAFERLVGNGLAWGLRGEPA